MSTVIDTLPHPGLGLQNTWTANNIFQARVEFKRGADIVLPHDAGAGVDLALGNDGNMFLVSSDGAATTVNAILATGWQAGSEVVLIIGSSDLLLKQNTAGGAGTLPMYLLGATDAASLTTYSIIKFTFDGLAWNEVARQTTNKYPMTVTGLNGSFILTGRGQESLGTSTAAANDLTLPSDGNSFIITGATQINAITTSGWQAGSVIRLKFVSNPVVKHATAGGAGTAQLYLAGSGDFNAAAESMLELMYDGSRWNELSRKVA